MSKFEPNELPPVYNQINYHPQSVPQTQAPPLVATHQPIILHQVQPPPPQQQQVISTIQIVHPGGCIHNFRAEFTCCGILCAIFFFPIGILCCLCMMEQRCSHCRMYA